MKKKILPVLILALSSITMAQNKTIDEGVIINGVRWATCNVDEKGSFAEKPESFGKFYQWNRNVAWSVTDSIVANWDNTRPSGDEWEKANDPSPAGWRVPTREEIESLFEEGKVSNEWLIQNGVSGRKFTDTATGNAIFLPAVGYRLNINGGILYDTGVFGHYWSAMPSDENYANGLYFSSTGSDYFYYDLYRTDARTIRSVAE